MAIRTSVGLIIIDKFNSDRAPVMASCSTIVNSGLANRTLESVLICPNNMSWGNFVTSLGAIQRKLGPEACESVTIITAVDTLAKEKFKLL